MYSPPQCGHLIHDWNKQNEQCLAKICMGTVNISIYHTSGACVMKNLKHGHLDVLCVYSIMCVQYYVHCFMCVLFYVCVVRKPLSEKQKENDN